MKNLTRIFLLTIIALLSTACASNKSVQVKTVKQSWKPKDWIEGEVIDSRYFERCKRKSNSGDRWVGRIAGGLIGNQFGGGDGRILMTILGIGVGDKIVDSNTKDKGDFYDCKGGYVTSVVYFDNFGQMRWHKIKHKSSKRKGTLIEFEL